MRHGWHDLLTQGAKLTKITDDILKELGFSAFIDMTKRGVQAPERSNDPWAGMDKDHKILLDAVGIDPVAVDTVIDRPGFKAEAVSSMMLILELEGHVQAAPGGRYSRINRSRGER